MPVLTLEDISLSIGETPLLDNIRLVIQAKDKIALVGRNGTGKSTLLKIMAQIEKADGGLVKSGNHKIALLGQDLPPSSDMSTFDFVSQGLQDLGNLLREYHHLTNDTPKAEQNADWLNQLHHLQQQIEVQQGWDIQHRIEKIMSELNLPQNQSVQALSGGWRRRLDLAKTLITEPDLLLLDEPTNHLDIDAIKWLEKTLTTYPKAVVFITHDRAMMQNIANYIIELDRGQLHTYQCDYETYLNRKSKREEDELTALKKFDQKLSEEEAWLRQGVKARRKRNQGRLRDLERLRKERKDYQEQINKPQFSSNIVSDSNKIIIEAENVQFGYDLNAPIIKDFTFYLQKGEKVAIIGQNGQGKTTLIKCLMGELPLQAGRLHHSPKNQIAYFDQKREALDLDASLIDNIAMGDDFVEINGKRQHIIGYLGDFLFSPKQCRRKARSLSGGEQNRLLLAKLFSQSANILVLDEPTNDLDLESLELLESVLLAYSGTLLIISHDRAFIDNIATHYIAFDGQGHIDSGVGGYSDWQNRQKYLQTQQEKKPTEKKINKSPQQKPTKSNKLNYNEKRELEQIPQLIAQVESKISILHNEMQDPKFYQQSKDVVKQTNEKLATLQSELENYYERWEDLESKNH